MLQQPTRTPQESRRRFRLINLTTMLPVVVAVGVFHVAYQSQTWSQAAVLSLGLAAAIVAFERWTAGKVLRVAIPCLIVAAPVWPFGLIVIDGPIQASFYSVCSVGSLVVSQLSRRRGLAAIGLVAYVGAVGVIGLVVVGPVNGGSLLSDVIIPTGITAIIVGLMFPNKKFYDVVADLEETHERESELAIMRERMRFASDLHDIQGHTLHVVKLKVALAQKLLHTDAERAEQELREVYTLVGDTIARTKELAHGQRRLNLSAEIENARNLLEATGAHVLVDRVDDVVGGESIDLLGQVLRETTTNILRHSRATLVRIAAGQRSITIVNDGVGSAELLQLRGLTVLARRISDAGGELSVRLEDGRFLTSATFPEVLK